MSTGRNRVRRRSGERPIYQFFFPDGSVQLPPVISSLSSGVPTSTTATITWTTDVISDSEVFWGLTTAYSGASSPIMQDTNPYVTSHSVVISGLVTATVYHYKVLTRTPGGIYTFSLDNTFTTA